MFLSSNQLASSLSLSPPRASFKEGLKQSAVMAILVDRQLDSKLATHLVFIMKSIDGSRHSGQIAFPGGKVERQDRSHLHTALRETEEEIGIQPEQLEVIGCLGYFSTLTTGFDTAVFVAKADAAFDYQAYEREVAAIFEIPISELLQQFNPDVPLNTRADFLNLHFHFDVKRFMKIKTSGWPHNREMICIWGLTARLLYSFFKRII